MIQNHSTHIQIHYIYIYSLSLYDTYIYIYTHVIDIHVYPAARSGPDPHHPPQRLPRHRQDDAPEALAGARR